MEACFGAFIQQDLSLLDVDDPDGEIGCGDGYDVSRLEPAMVARLGPGESVQFADPKRPGGGFIDFVKIMLRGIAAGFGLSYEVVFSDYAGMNYSSARTAILDARRAFRVWQRFLDVQLCTPIWQLAIEEGVLREKLPLIGDWQSYAAELTEVRWIAPGWDWVDPLKEGQRTQDLRARGLQHRDRGLCRTRCRSRRGRQAAQARARLRQAHRPDACEHSDGRRRRKREGRAGGRRVSGHPILDYLGERLWALHPSTLEHLTGLVTRHARGIKLDASEVDEIRSKRADGGDPYPRDPRGYELRGNVAVIPLRGVVAKYAQPGQWL
jgi:hypothetical protein